MAIARIHGKKVGSNFSVKNAINVALSAISGMSARNVQEGIAEVHTKLQEETRISNVGVEWNTSVVGDGANAQIERIGNVIYLSGYVTLADKNLSSPKLLCTLNVKPTKLLQSVGIGLQYSGSGAPTPTTLEITTNGAITACNWTNTGNTYLRLSGAFTIK